MFIVQTACSWPHRPQSLAPSPGHRSLPGPTFCPSLGTVDRNRIWCAKYAFLAYCARNSHTKHDWLCNCKTCRHACAATRPALTPYRQRIRARNNTATCCTAKVSIAACSGASSLHCHHQGPDTMVSGPTLHSLASHINSAHVGVRVKALHAGHCALLLPTRCPHLPRLLLFPALQSTIPGLLDVTLVARPPRSHSDLSPHDAKRPYVWCHVSSVSY